MNQFYWGTWIGLYPDKTQEVIRIVQENEWLFAIKEASSSDYVPAGEITWKYNLRTRKTFGRIAQEGFAHAKWISAQLWFLNRETIRVCWVNAGHVDFRLDTAPIINCVIDAKV